MFCANIILIFRKAGFSEIEYLIYKGNIPALIVGTYLRQFQLASKVMLGFYRFEFALYRFSITGTQKTASIKVGVKPPPLIGFVT